MTKSPSSNGAEKENGKRVELMMVDDGRIRVSDGDAAGGRYVILDYDEIKDYVLSLKPRAELVERYSLADE